MSRLLFAMSRYVISWSFYTSDGLLFFISGCLSYLGIFRVLVFVIISVCNVKVFIVSLGICYYICNTSVFALFIRVLYLSLAMSRCLSHIDWCLLRLGVN